VAVFQRTYSHRFGFSIIIRLVPFFSYHENTFLTTNHTNHTNGYLQVFLCIPLKAGQKRPYDGMGSLNLKSAARKFE